MKKFYKLREYDKFELYIVVTIVISTLLFVIVYIIDFTNHIMSSNKTWIVITTILIFIAVIYLIYYIHIFRQFYLKHFDDYPHEINNSKWRIFQM